MMNLLLRTSLRSTQKMRTLMFLITQWVMKLIRVLKLLDLWHFVMVLKLLNLAVPDGAEVVEPVAVLDGDILGKTNAMNLLHDAKNLSHHATVQCIVC